MVNDPAKIRMVEPVKVWIEHRLQFYIAEPYGSLNWTAKEIEALRSAHDIPDNAEMKVSRGRVIFTWHRRFEDGAD